MHWICCDILRYIRILAALFKSVKGTLRGKESFVEICSLQQYDSILVYLMQCLKFPKKVCDEVNSVMAKFWLGQQGEERKFHSEGLGGMGFRDLNLFNLALLAKQCWRLCLSESRFSLG